MVLLFASCAKQEPASWQSAAVRFSASVPETRTVFKPSSSGVTVTWAQDDTIGIWSSNTTRGNFPYVAGVNKTDATKAQFSVVSEDKMFLYDGTSCTYYAYWPYDPAQNEVTPELRFSLPALQRQAAAGDVSHLSGLSIFRADPVTVSGADAQADFAFRPALSNIHLALAMDAGQTLSVPVRKVRLVSADADLSATSASIDLRTAGAAPAVAEGSKDVTLSFDTMPALTTAGNADAYLAVVPGKHQAALTAEITAVDGSVASYSLPAVEFLPGKIYSHEIKVRETDFALAEPFSISASSLNIAAGESVNFTISGAAIGIDFWSGEVYHDYAYAGTDRIEVTHLPMSFKHAISAGTQNNHPLVKVSSDFSGVLTEAAVLSAHWTDISDHFTFASENLGTDNPITTNLATYNKYFVDSGEYDLGNSFGDATSLYVAMFWHADKYDATLLNTRTVSYITRWRVGSDFEISTTSLTFIWNKDAWTAGGVTASQVPAWQTPKNDVPTYPAFRFMSDFRPTDARDAYAVINTPFTATKTNHGPDKPQTVQASTEDTPSSFSYTFDQPGTYTVVFEVTLMGLDGSQKKENKTFTVNVS